MLGWMLRCAPLQHMPVRGGVGCWVGCVGAYLLPYTHITHHITSQYTTPHHITIYRITSHRITPHHITIHRITSHHITIHCITSHRITPRHITTIRGRHNITLPPHLITPQCHTTSHRSTTPHHTIVPHHITPQYHTTSHHSATPHHTTVPHQITPQYHTKSHHTTVPPLLTCRRTRPSLTPQRWGDDPLPPPTYMRTHLHLQVLWPR